MPRGPREKSETGIYHIILRGINRQTIFEDDEDRKRFLHTLKKYKQISGYEVYAYCIMGNHLHLLLKVGEEPLEQVMRRLAGSYVYWYNEKYDRIGNLFQDRLRSETVEDDSYLLTVVRYIHQNPLKAGLLNNINDYYWSSYKDYTNSNNVNGITDTAFVLSLFGKHRKEALSEFIKFNQESINDHCLEVKEIKQKLTDAQLIDLIEHKFNIRAEMIKDEPRETMTAILREILNVEGVSTRQLARVSNVEINKIWRL